MKIVVTVGCSFLGVLAGIYAGNRFFYQAPRQDYVAPNPLDSISVTLVPGDSFPPETYTDTAGKVGNFRDLLLGKNSLVVFANLYCEPCHDFLRLFQKHLRHQLQKKAQVIVCLSTHQRPVPEEYQGLMAGCELIFYDDATWSDKYRMRFWPSLIVVDQYGFVNHVQLGYDGYIDYELFDYIFFRGV
ncbi:MAG: hypothetical protein PVH24_06840 [Candidatus Zixiibacteriota bacterium]